MAPRVCALGGWAGVGARVLRAGMLGTAAAGAMPALAGPVLGSVFGAAGRALSGALGHPPLDQAASVAWSADRRLHLDLDPLLPFPRWAEHADEVQAAVRALPGVTAAHVEGALGRLIVEREEHVDSDTIWRTAGRAIAAAMADDATADTGDVPRTAPFADPGDPLAILVPAVAAAMDAVAVAAAVTGWVGRLPAAPRAARAAAAVVSHQPRVVALLEARLGRVGTDFLLNAATAATHGLGQAPATPLLDLVQRAAQVSEALAHRQTWRIREPHLASQTRPQAPIVPVLSSAGETSGEPRHSWAAAAAGEVSHVAVDAAIDVAVDAAKGATGGAVEEYVDQSAGGSLMAAAGALLAGGGTTDVADAVLAGVPKAAHLGREAFAAVLGRGLAQSGQLVLDPGALRRLDRVQVVVIDGAALRGDARTVLSAQAVAPGWDEDRIYEVADAVLHGEQCPEPDPDELPADNAGLHWHRQTGAPAAPAEGLEHADVLVDGQRVGTVAVGWELDPYAVPLLHAAYRTGTRVVLRHVAGTDELGASVAAAHPCGTSLLELVRDLRDDRGPVLLVTALHPDFASTDTLAALAVADVGVALDDPDAATAWTADIITGSDLAAVVRVLSALPAARRASESAVRLAKAGSTLAGLLLVTGETGSRSRLGLGRWLSPVNAAGAAALLSGALAGRQVVTLPDPDPQPLTAWHALDPEIVYRRLTGGAQPLAAAPVTPRWRRRLADLGDSAPIDLLRRPVSQLISLAGATRRELNDPLTPILAVGAAASAILGSGVDALLVTGVMTVNATVGGVQHLRAEHAAAELFARQDPPARRVVIPVVATTKRRLEAARHAGRTVTVPVARLRPGDVIDLRAPEVVPADARLLVAGDLEVDESFLTGESVPVSKQVDPVAATEATERASMVFEGSAIVAGNARAIVVATGTGTAAHRAISAVSHVGPAVGVQTRLRQLTSKVLPLTLAGGATVTGLVLIRRGALRQAVADGVAIAVAAVPEGLPLVATLAQLAAARRLSRLGVLVRSPRTLEALGRVQTVCFDKTGTLTENRLHVVAAVPASADPDESWPRADDPRGAAIVRSAGHACPGPDSGEGHAHATDEAILAAVASLASTDDSGWELLAEVPFESSRGFAAAVGRRHRADEAASHAPMLVLKGAPEVILPRCRFVEPGADRAHADALVHNLADQGLRVLAVAERALPDRTAVAPGVAPGVDTGGDTDIDADAIAAEAHDLRLLGYVGLADIARPSARPLLEQLVAAGRNVALITGDHPVTARAIARHLGLPADVRVVTGDELAALDEEARAELAGPVQVFARVTPEQKVQVVSALQRSGRVTAMVGDGANDAAAIRMADVGIGVAGRGSSAARGAADLVLTEDDLSALLDALVEGRNMWGSVRDALTILLGGNAGEVAFTVIGTALGRGHAPVSTRQLLLVNLLTDMFPALAVAVTPQGPVPEETAEPTGDELAAAHRAYRQSVLSEPIPSLDRPLVQAIINRGAITAAATITAWAIGRWTPGTRRRTSTMALTALLGTQLAQTLLTRHRSPLVVATAAGSTAVLIAIVQIPGISHFFGCTPLGPVAWSGVLAATAAATAVSVLAPTWLTRHAPIAHGTGVGEDLAARAGGY